MGRRSLHAGMHIIHRGHLNKKRKEARKKTFILHAQLASPRFFSPGCSLCYLGAFSVSWMKLSYLDGSTRSYLCYFHTVCQFLCFSIFQIAIASSFCQLFLF